MMTQQNPNQVHPKYEYHPKFSPEFLLSIIVALATFVGWMFNNQLGLEKRITTIEVESKNTVSTLDEIKDGMLRLNDKIDSLIAVKQEAVKHD